MTSTRPQQRLATGVLPWLAAAGAAGLLVGAATSGAQTVLGGSTAAGLANAVSPWLVVPFLVASRAPRRGPAAVLGVVACLAEVVGYYATSALRGFGIGAPAVALWTVAALVAGAVFGVAGRSWWTATGRERGLGAALLVAAWLCEGVVGYAVVLGYAGQAAVFAAVAVALLLLLGRHGRQHRALLAWLAPALLLGVLGELGLHAIA